MGPIAAVSVVIIDDHPAVVDGVAAWCAAAVPPITVIETGDRLGLALTGPGATADVVLLDLQLSAGPLVLRGLQQLVDHGRRVIVYTQNADSDIALRCIDIGAVTYLTKAEGKDHLIPAIRSVAADQPYTPPQLSGALAADRRSDRPPLTPRERDVLRSWFESDSKELVAKRLRISVKTVDTHIQRVRIKYADVGRPAPTKAALVTRALQDGLVGLEDL